jgi:hypothetical protein
VTEHSYATQKSCVANVSFDCHSDCVKKCSVRMQNPTVNDVSKAACSETEDNGNDNIWTNLSKEVVNFDVNYEACVLEQFCSAEETLISYLSGWVAKKCIMCVNCRAVLTKPLSENACCSTSNDISAAY